VRHRGKQWHYIVIHHSATDTGSAAMFDAWHRKKGWDGLAYDFVIGNGTGSADGAVEVGYRWREQKRGAHAGNDLMNIEGIGICLVGDFTKTRPSAAQMHSLSRLCNFLSVYCGIPRESFRLHGDVRNTTCPGPLFPRDFLAPQHSQRVTAGAAHGGSGTE
jgi:N-acetyl-anhydromuramyl-L-alanine amidase AmpD